MKYGAHCYLFTECWRDDQLHFLDLAAELGLTMFELSVGDDVHFTPQLTRDRAQALGLTLAIGPGGHWPVECDLSTADPVAAAQGLAWHIRQVDLAAELGAVAYAGALYGHPGVIQRRRPPAGELPRTAELLNRLADYAAQRNVAIVLEPMSHFRTHLVNTPAQLMDLIQLADHGNLLALIDTYHIITEVRDFGAGIRLCGDRLWGIHACENDRGVPGGGLVPWTDVFTALQDIAFDGYVTMETYNSSLGDFALRRGMFHNVCPDGAAFVRTGLHFLEETAAAVAGARHG